MVEPFLPGNSLTSCGANAPTGSSSPTEMPHQDKNVRCPVPCGVPRGRRTPWFYPRQALSLENSHPLHLLSVLVWDLRIRPIYGHLLRTLKKRTRWFYCFVFSLQHYGKITKAHKLPSPDRRPSDQLSGTWGPGKGCKVVATVFPSPVFGFPLCALDVWGRPQAIARSPIPGLRSLSTSVCPHLN